MLVLMIAAGSYYALLGLFLLAVAASARGNPLAPNITPKQNTMEIQMTDQLGNLTAEQIDHLSLGLEHAYGLALQEAGGGRYWLTTPHGGALLVRTHRTVEHIWRCAEAISAATEDALPAGVGRHQNEGGG